MSQLPSPDTPADFLNGGDSLRPQKRIFIGLLVATCLLLGPLLALLWYVPYVGFTKIHPRLPLIFGITFGVLVLLILGGVFLLILTIILGRDLFISRRLRGIILKIVFPLLIGVGRLFGVSKDQVQRSFIEINNQLVLAQKIKTTPDKILLLMPHCLQFHDCPVRITGNVENCQRCGKCHIKGLVEISDKYQVGLAVATGGTIARRIIVDRRPKVIIATACERDLTSGLKDSYPLPVFGVLNRRPHGPCFDTEVDLEHIEQAVQAFLKTPGQKLPERPSEQK
jgi:hypothetical protein